MQACPLAVHIFKLVSKSHGHDITFRPGSHRPWDKSKKGRKSKELFVRGHIGRGQFGTAQKKEIMNEEKEMGGQGRVRDRGEGVGERKEGGGGCEQGGADYISFQ